MTHMNSMILTLILFVPLAGAAVLALLPDRGKTMQWGALAVTLLTLLLTLHLPYWYNYTAGGMQFVTNHQWLAAPAIRYHLGVDGLSMWLIVLTGVLAPLGVLASWKAPRRRLRLERVAWAAFSVACNRATSAPTPAGWRQARQYFSRSPYSAAHFGCIFRGL